MTWAVPMSVPGALPSHVNGTPVPPVPGGPKLIGVDRSSLNTIVPSLLKLADIFGQVFVRSFVQTRASMVPVAVGSRLPITTRGLTGLLGEKVSTATNTLSALPAVSVTPKRMCHSELGGNTAIPVFCGSSDFTFIMNVSELSPQLANGSPTLSRSIVSEPFVG